MVGFRNGLSQIAIDGFFANIRAEYRRKGYHKFTLKEGGKITPQQTMDFLRSEGIYFRRNGNVFELAKVQTENSNVQV